MSEKYEIPAEEEIRRLPRWAVVAYAARCARVAWRAAEGHEWPEGPEGRWAHEVLRAIEITEKSAAEVPILTDAYFADIAGDAANAAAEAFTQAADGEDTFIAASAARSASRAAHASFAAAASYPHSVRHSAAYASPSEAHASAAWGARTSATAAAEAHDSATAYAAALAAEDEEAGLRAIDDATAEMGTRIPWVDFSALLRRSLAEKWTDDTPVPPEVFAPLPPA